MRLLHFIFFSLGLPLVLHVTATNNECSHDPEEKFQTSSYDESNSGPQQKMPIKPNILPGKSNATKCKLEKKTEGQNRIKSTVGTKNSEFEEKELFICSYDDKTKTFILNGDVSSEGSSLLACNIPNVSSNSNVKTLIFKNLAIERKIDPIARFLNCYEDTLEVLIFDYCLFVPDFAIHHDFKLEGLHTVKISYCALNPEILKKILAVLPSSLQTLELSHLCFNTSVDKYKHFGEYFTLDFSFLNVKCFTHLKNLVVKENGITKFRFENFEELEEFECDKIFKSYDLLKDFYNLFWPITDEISKLSTLKLDSSHELSIHESDLSRNLSQWNNLLEDLPYLLNVFYISAELVTTKFDNELDQIYESMKLVKEKCSEVYELQRSENYHSDNLNELKPKLSELSNEISKLQRLLPKECPKLSDKLKQLRNLKRIKIGKYDFRDTLDTFIEKSIVVDNDTSVGIFHDDLPNIHSTLATFTNVWFSLECYTADDINLIPLENESKFKHLNSVTFYGIKHTRTIAFMNRILNRFHSIHTITVELSIENITGEQIAESFDGIKTFENIENVHFILYASSDTFATCEFIIQILKRVPNLKSLSLKLMKKEVIDMLFERLQKEQVKFPNLQKINTAAFNGPINLLLWFIQTFPIEELNITSYKLLCDSGELLDNFSSKTLRKLRISSAPTSNDDLLKKCFSNMKNLKELHLLCNLDLIAGFKNNSTIEKVVFEDTWLNFENARFNSEYSEEVFAFIKTFKSLQCIYVKFHKNSNSNVISAFNKHFEGRKVELIFYSEEGYF